MTEDQIFDWFHQILDGVNHLHKHHIYHRYLKPQNILIAFDGVLKIVDLEKARRIISSLHEGNKIPSHEVIWALKITGDIS